MIKWVADYTRYRDEDKQSRLELLFTKGINIEKNFNVECHLEEVTMRSLKLRLRQIWKKSKKNHIKRKEGIMQKLYCNEDFQWN